MYETPQIYSWKDPASPPNMPALQIYFLNEPQVNVAASAKEGIQVYDNVLIAYVAPMGMPKSNAAHEVERTTPDGTVTVNQRIAYKYAAPLKMFKEGLSAETAGTPLKELLGMTPATIMNLRSRGIQTIEMLADMPDGAGHDLMGFWELRDRAQKHVQMRKENAPALRMDAIEKAHQEEVGSLKRQLDELRALVTAQEDPPKRGPGRPPKVQEAA
jgi:hypothetical protein